MPSGKGLPKTWRVTLNPAIHEWARHWSSQRNLRSDGLGACASKELGKFSKKGKERNSYFENDAAIITSAVGRWS